jgi:hypothetical protein
LSSFGCAGDTELQKSSFGKLGQDIIVDLKMPPETAFGGIQQVCGRCFIAEKKFT